MSHTAESERERLRLACKDAMAVLSTQAPMGAVGRDGPTLRQLNACIEKTGLPYDDDACYHAMQQAWRILEKGLRDDRP